MQTPPWPDAVRLSDIVHAVFTLSPGMYVIEYWITKSFTVVDAEMCTEYYVDALPSSERMRHAMWHTLQRIPGYEHDRSHVNYGYLDGVSLHHSCHADSKNAALITADLKWIVFRQFEK